jgi:hypothetical protein
LLPVIVPRFHRIHRQTIALQSSATKKAWTLPRILVPRVVRNLKPRLRPSSRLGDDDAYCVPAFSSAAYSERSEPRCSDPSCDRPPRVRHLPSRVRYLFRPTEFDTSFFAFGASDLGATARRALRASPRSHSVPLRNQQKVKGFSLGQNAQQPRRAQRWGSSGQRAEPSFRTQAAESANSGSVTESELAVLDKLRKIIDPDFGLDIVSCGFIKNLEVRFPPDVMILVTCGRPGWVRGSSHSLGPQSQDKLGLCGLAE